MRADIDREAVEERPDTLERALAELDAERTARRREQALIRSGRALSATLELRDVLPAILHELRLVVPYDTASVQELRDDRMVVVGGDGIDLDVFGGVGFDAYGGGTPNSEVLARRAPVIVDDILDDHPYWDFPHPAHEMSGVRCWMGIPLLFGDECIGMITLDAFEPRFYDEDDARTALAFASQAAVALENARAYARICHEVEERRKAEEHLREANEALQRRMAEIEALQDSLREQVVRDPLTGLFNRRYLMETLDREVARSRREDEPLSVILIDVDHFKSVNDTLGHDAGDRILATVGGYLLGQVRAGDAACRIGGEEFVIVLPNTPLEAALRRAEQWRRAVRDDLSADDERAITISVGVAAAPRHGGTGDDLLRAADAAMYEAKALGRDRVVAAGAGGQVANGWRS